MFAASELVELASPLVRIFQQILRRNRLHGPSRIAA